MSLVEGEAPIWLTSLQLLGFRELEPKVVSLTRNTFDHSNPAAFQQVFHFLLSQIVPGRVKAECRDCWPILDKKQEAEFRRKVVMLVKEVQGSLVTAPLPQVNPALFMSPGGHKFKAFLSNLANQVPIAYCLIRIMQSHAVFPFRLFDSSWVLRELFWAFLRVPVEGFLGNRLITG